MALSCAGLLAAASSGSSTIVRSASLEASWAWGAGLEPLEVGEAGTSSSGGL